MLPFQVASQTCEWSELIGKDLVLYRYGRLKDGIFTDYRFTNPAGAEPVETLTLTDSTHFEWKYSLSGDFKREIELKGTKIDLYPPFWNNRYIFIVQRNDNTADTIQTSTHKITNASLADHPLDWENDIDVALNIEEQKKAPTADCYLYVKVEVIFNGETQYRRIIPFDYIAKAAPTGVKSITDNQPANDHWYGIQGTHMDSKPVQNGVYIHNQNKVIIK